MGKNEIHWLSFLAGISISAAVTVWTYIGADYFLDRKTTTNASQVETGYVIPSKLEISVKDLNENNVEETHLNYDGTDYLFRLNNKGNPYMVEYEVIPSETTPPQIVLKE